MTAPTTISRPATYGDLMDLAARAIYDGSALVQHLPFNNRTDAQVVLDHYRDALDALGDHVWHLVTPARRSGVLASMHPEATERAAVSMALAIDELTGHERPLPFLPTMNVGYYFPLGPKFTATVSLVAFPVSLFKTSVEYRY